MVAYDVDGGFMMVYGDFWWFPQIAGSYVGHWAGNIVVWYLSWECIETIVVLLLGVMLEMVRIAGDWWNMPISGPRPRTWCCLFVYVPLNCDHPAPKRKDMDIPRAGFLKKAYHRSTTPFTFS